MKRKSMVHVKTFNFRDFAPSNTGRCPTEINYEFMELEVSTGCEYNILFSGM
jgi:hypothetical protein